MALSDKDRTDWNILAEQLTADDPALAQALTDGNPRWSPGSRLLQFGLRLMIALTGALTLFAIFVSQFGIALLSFAAYIIVTYNTRDAPIRTRRRRNRR
jgi:hypothetical protein